MWQRFLFLQLITALQMILMEGGKVAVTLRPLLLQARDLLLLLIPVDVQPMMSKKAAMKKVS